MHVHTHYISHITHMCTLSHIHKCRHTHIHITHCTDVHSPSHTNMHCTLPHKHTHSHKHMHAHTCALTLLPATLRGSMLGCCRRAARRPGLWVPTGLGQPPASASLLPHHPGPRPGLWATGGLCVWPHGRPPGLRCPGPSNRPAPSASSSWLVAPSVTLPAVGDRSLLMPSRRARGDWGAGLTGACRRGPGPTPRWEVAQRPGSRCLAWHQPLPTVRRRGPLGWSWGPCVGEAQLTLASISPRGLQCCGPVTPRALGDWLHCPGEPDRVCTPSRTGEASEVKGPSQDVKGGSSQRGRTQGGEMGAQQPPATRPQMTMPVLLMPRK